MRVSTSKDSIEATPCGLHLSLLPGMQAVFEAPGPVHSSAVGWETRGKQFREA